MFVEFELYGKTLKLNRLDETGEPVADLVNDTKSLWNKAN